MAGYIPQRDSLLLPWALNFSTLITASPATYGLLAGDATAIAAVYSAYNTAYGLAINPATRTPVTVANKDTAKITMLATIRPYAQSISLNAGVSPANKIALGVNPRTNTPSPIPAPTTLPVLSFQSSIPNGIVMRYRDSLASPSVKSKPPGATSLQLNAMPMATGSPTASIESWPTISLNTKAPLIVDTSTLTSGQRLYMAARWVTRKGLAGAWSTPVSAVIP